jgi:hypothetical protein
MCRITPWIIIRCNMNSLRNDVYDLFVNIHVWNTIYLEFYHSIIYIANEGCHVRISYNILVLFWSCKGLAQSSSSLLSSTESSLSSTVSLSSLHSTPSSWTFVGTGYLAFYPTIFLCAHTQNLVSIWTVAGFLILSTYNIALWYGIWHSFLLCGFIPSEVVLC